MERGSEKRSVILITGGTGFIGSRLAQTLRERGYRVLETRRRVEDPNRHIGVDFVRATQPDAWRPVLEGVDVVVNAVGILREHGAQTFEAIHSRAPRALFAACATAGVAKIIQISALGADDGTTGYFRSKHAADEFLRTLRVDWTIVQPSVVYGPGGTSARLFSMLASAPLIALPGRGDHKVQPVHIDDVITALVTLIESQVGSRCTIALTGPRALPLREFLGALRASLGLRPTRFLPIPMPIMRAAARIAQLSRHSLLDADTLNMLEQGNTADAGSTRALLNREPIDVSSFIDPRLRDDLRAQAQLTWLLPLVRLSIAIVWIWTGIVSLGVYPLQQSYALLERTGVAASLAPLMLYGAATLDLLLGFSTLLLHRRRWLWLAQLALIIGYTAIITVKLPEFWLHPYGPILKNLPMLAAIYMLYQLEKR